ncbi:hypothetical protein [Thermococcus sp. Bubb.Bath]|uniref:hypothetical protein n=1 Tax=Thermococcus sp. Bubb.Bath TaxID=1638242 RepID=UPI0014390B68|nr:hypothetical protein [Thermococcus sp. Bubb.Bath]NJF25961.1 hypothetical protein [Thermococcus sp. Bubb.Bath]
MIGSLLRIIAKKKGFVLVFLSLILVSLIIFHLVLQVGVLVDKNVEYQFREYRPHVVYFTRFTLPKAATSQDYPLTNDIGAFEDSLEKTLDNENFSAHTLVGFSWSYINPIRVGGKQVNIWLYTSQIIFHPSKNLGSMLRTTKDISLKMRS